MSESPTLLAPGACGSMDDFPPSPTVPALLILLSRGGAAKCTSPCQDCEIFHNLRLASFWRRRDFGPETGSLVSPKRRKREAGSCASQYDLSSPLVGYWITGTPRHPGWEQCRVTPGDPGSDTILLRGLSIARFLGYDGGEVIRNVSFLWRLRAGPISGSPNYTTI